jgi:TorA maturation chaperone TorD
MSRAQDFRQLNQSRAQIYRMLDSLYFTELTLDQIKSLSELDFGAFADLDPELAKGAKEIERALRHVHPGVREDFAVDYAHTFLAAGSGKTEARAVPFESVYTSDTGLLMGPARQSVYKIMLKEGVLPDENLHVPDDHLSFECAFMAHMANKSAEALEAGDSAEARRCVEVQKDFRTEHLANWIDAFYEAVDKTCRTRFYRGAALLTKTFIRLDEELIAECAALLEN